MDIALLTGIVGAFIILVSFILNQLNKLKNDDLIYDLLNFVGSALLIVYSVFTNSPPFVVLNLVWAAVSLKDIIKKFYKK